MQVVNDMRILNAMDRKGLITLHPHTGNKVWWNGQARKCCYVEDTAQLQFEYKGKKYERQYFDGCFFPFVVFVPDINVSSKI